MNAFSVILSSIIIGIASVLLFKKAGLISTVNFTSLRTGNVTAIALAVQEFIPDTFISVHNTSRDRSHQEDQIPQQSATSDINLNHETNDIMASAAKTFVPRAIRKVVLASEQAEGAGARVRRSIGTPALRNLSPFLMLDHFSIKPGAGFPDHPHRGQETITYLLSGGVDHEDFAGNKGTLGPGDLQFMTAGRGIVHAEMPRQNEDGSANVGLQLWVDLPASLKSCEPRYRDLRATEIPTAQTDDGRATVKVISGRSCGVESVKDLAYTPVWILDICIQPGGSITQEIPEGWTAFAYTLDGADVLLNNDRAVAQYHNVVFDDGGNSIHATVDEAASGPARFVLIAGTPLDQEVVQYGPFVLNSKQEVYQALMDYRGYENGFERARGWSSEIGKSMME